MTKTTDGYFVEVGEASKLFRLSDYRNNLQKCVGAALRWREQQIIFQAPKESKEEIQRCHDSLLVVAETLKDHFPKQGEDWFFVRDDFYQSIGLRYGHLVIFEAENRAYNIEIITNWFTKKRMVICKGISFGNVIEIVKNSEQSRSFKDFESTSLFMSDDNLDFIQTLCGVI